MALFDDLSTIFGAYATKINSLKSNLGNIANLNTSVKTSIVDAINAAKAEIDDAKTDLGVLDEKMDSVVGTLTPEIKAALLNCFAHVGWDHGGDKSYYDALEEALYADNVTRVEAVLSLGTHEVYNTDNIEALRNFLTVTAYFDDNTNEVVDTYTLEGDLSEIGTNTVTVKYGRSKRTTISVPTVANTTGLLYEWDFTKGLRDLRQGKVAVLQNNESYNPPTLNANGITFDGPQAVRLFDVDEAMGNIIFGKTIQADVTSYVPVTTNGNVRFLCFGDDHEQWATQGQVVWTDGLIYRNANSYWTIYNGAGWATNAFSGMTTRGAVSGHTIGLYINASGTCKLYVDGASKGTVSGANLRKSYLYGFRIGDTGPSNSMYNATIRGLRIYNGEVA